MHGNVWEWVQDRYAKYQSEAQTDPVGPAEGSAYRARGGSFYSSAPYLRSACRNGSSPGRRYGFFGGRLRRTE